MIRCSLLTILAILPLRAQPVVTWAGETMRLASASVAALGPGWRLTLAMANDNGNAALPSSYRRWWHCQVSNLNPLASHPIEVRVTNAGYSDIILPVWSSSTNSGAAFTAFARLPISATPTFSGGTHIFTFTKPLGVTDVRLAKYFPWPVSAKNAWLAGIAGHPSGHVRSITVLGASAQGRAIEQVEITDGSVPDTQKRRVWVHAGVHPAETTAYFTMEGFVAFLLSGDPRAEAILDRIILDIVPMPNPDGVHLGNYRTTAQSVNIEDDWSYPYAASTPETAALRNAITGFMGTPAAPSSNPIEVLLNLHSSHNVAFPFHYRHTANAAFNPTTSPSGVVPAVNALETAWINAFRARSPFANAGTTQSSTCSPPSRPFVECMMHDRWSIDPTWTGPPNFLRRVMAITFEGTYGFDATGTVWNTPDSYRQAGREMALALGDNLGILPSLSATPFGIPCAGGPLLTGSIFPAAGGALISVLVTQSPVTPAWLVVGTATTAIPLPPLWCPLLVTTDLLIPATVDPAGSWSLSVNWPAGVSLDVHTQFVAAAPTAGGYDLHPSAGLTLGVIW